MWAVQPDLPRAEQQAWVQGPCPLGHQRPHDAVGRALGWGGPGTSSQALPPMESPGGCGVSGPHHRRLTLRQGWQSSHRPNSIQLGPALLAMRLPGQRGEGFAPFLLRNGKACPGLVAGSSTPASLRGRNLTQLFHFPAHAGESPLSTCTLSRCRPRALPARRAIPGPARLSLPLTGPERGRGGGSLHAGPWWKCQELNTPCCRFCQHPHIPTCVHMGTCMHATVQNHLCTPCLCSRVCVCICGVHTPRVTHTSTPCTPLHTHAGTHPVHGTYHTTHACAHTGTHPTGTHTLMHTPQRTYICLPTHCFRPGSCGSDIPRSRAAERGHPVSRVQRGKRPGPGCAQAALPSAPCGGGWAQEGALAWPGQKCVNSPPPSGNSLGKVLLESAIRYNFKTTTMVRRKK